MDETIPGRRRMSKILTVPSGQAAARMSPAVGCQATLWIAREDSSIYRHSSTPRFDWMADVEDADEEEDEDDRAVLKTTTMPLVVDTASRSGLAGWKAKSVVVKLLLVPCRTSKLHVQVI